MARIWFCGCGHTNATHSKFNKTNGKNLYVLAGNTGRLNEQMDYFMMDDKPQCQRNSKENKKRINTGGWRRERLHCLQPLWDRSPNSAEFGHSKALFIPKPRMYKPWFVSFKFLNLKSIFFINLGGKCFVKTNNLSHYYHSINIWHKRNLSQGKWPLQLC